MRRFLAASLRSKLRPILFAAPRDRAEMMHEESRRAERARKVFFLLMALPAVLRAAMRVWWLARRYGLEDLTDRLRRVRPLRLGFLNHPRYLDGSVGRLLPILPPWHLGPCLKRSYVLLDLWARCGLEPKLHLGMARSAGGRHFHAWVTVPGSSTVSSDSRVGYHEIWSR